MGLGACAREGVRLRRALSGCVRVRVRVCVHLRCGNNGRRERGEERNCPLRLLHHLCLRLAVLSTLDIS